MIRQLSRFHSTLWAAFFALLLLSFLELGNSLITARMPQEGAPAELYSTQQHDDLRLAFTQAIDKAQESILLIVYSLQDNHIIQALKEKGEAGIPTQVICDAKASQGVARKLGTQVSTTLRQGKGLMHQKILVIDKKQVWIGSANMTTASLKWHSNLVTALQSPSLAAYITQKADMMSKEGLIHPILNDTFTVGGQKIEMWFLPDNPNGTEKITQLIRTAKKTIRVAMFTWTRTDFTDELIQARERGVNVTVALDAQSGHGVSAAIAKRLSDGGIPVRFSKGAPLFHYKFMVIDDKRLVNGSANWTKAAFAKNDDGFLILHNLTSKQKAFLKALWNVILAETTPLEIISVDY